MNRYDEAIDQLINQISPIGAQASIQSISVAIEALQRVKNYENTIENDVIHAHWSNKYLDYYYCSQCGIGAPFARYKRKNGVNARDLTDYCPNCGSIMDEIEKCKTCKWSRDGHKNHESGVCLNDCYTGENFERKD